MVAQDVIEVGTFGIIFSLVCGIFGSRMCDSLVDDVPGKKHETLEEACFLQSKVARLFLVIL